MSVVAKTRTSKKTGKQYTKYFASVYEPELKKYRWSRGYDSRNEAVKAEAKLIRDIEQGKKELSKENYTFKQVGELWFQATKSTYEESTWMGYKGHFRSLEQLFTWKVKEVTPQHIQWFKNDLSAKYKPATVNKKMYLISMIFDYAKDILQLIESNPCSNIKKDTVHDTEKVTWDSKTINYFLKLPEVRSSEYFPMLVLSFSLGLRPGEVCGIRPQDVFFDGTLSLVGGLNKMAHKTHLKTHRSHRTIELSPQLHLLIRSVIMEKDRRKRNNPLYEDSGYLFTREDGFPINPNSYSRAFRKLVKQHNQKLDALEKIPDKEMYLPAIRLYDARHSFATNTIIAMQQDPKTISDIMGSSVNTILKTYVHSNSNARKATIMDYSEQLFK